MSSDGTPFGSSPRGDTAMKHARALATRTGKPATVYHRPIDNQWFVRSVDDPAPPGLTLNMAVQPSAEKPVSPDIPEHPLDGPFPTDLER